MMFSLGNQTRSDFVFSVGVFPNFKKLTQCTYPDLEWRTDL